MAAVAATYLVGYGGSVSIDANALAVGKWTANHAVGTFDATNSTTAGASFPERTIESFNGSFQHFLPAAGTAPVFLVGSVYPGIFYHKSGKGYTCNVLITGVNEDCDIRGGVTLDVGFMSQGAITVS